MQDGQQNEPGWVFKPGDQQPDKVQEAAVSNSGQTIQTEAVEVAQPAPSSSVGHVEWNASEYLANPKSGGWYGLLAITSVTLAVLAYLVTKDIVSTVVIAILGVIVGVFAARQPRTLDYKIDNQGIHIGQKFYPYENFKSFSVANEHAIGFISLLPLKRFMPPLIIHYAADDEERIAQTLADYLPYEDHKPDVVDNFTRRIRF